MASASVFNGFPKESVKFYTDLKLNNNRPWFEAHKSDFEYYVMTPAKDFVVAMGEALRSIAPGINADPRVNKSIFRIYRDTRFSKDKTPYKTNLALWFWEGSRAKFESPGFYFHLEPSNLMLGAGIHTFSKPLLKTYRDSVVNPDHGTTLVGAVKSISQKGSYNIGGEHYKRLPRGYEAEQPYADLLRYNGLTVGIETEIPETLYTADLVDYCMARYEDMSPLHSWLLGMIERVSE